MPKYRIDQTHGELIIQVSTDEDPSWTYVCSVRFGNQSKEKRTENTWRTAIDILKAYERGLIK